MPLLVFEVSKLNDERLYGDLVEILKSCIELPAGRGAHDRKGRYVVKVRRTPLGTNR